MIWILAVVACTKDTTDTAPEPVDCSTRALEVPSPRGEAAGVWDAERGRMVFFGGDEGTPVECRSQTEFVSETWAFHPDCDNFEQLGTDGPPTRGRMAAALDSVGQQMIIHGGRTREGTSGTYTLHDDTWAFDLATDTWRLVTEDGPGARTNHVAEAHDGIVYLYGGNNSRDGASFRVLEDLWSLDTSTGTWTEISDRNDPGARLFHASTMSDDGGTLYVYGGGDEGAFFGPFFGDLWALDLGTMEWTLLDDGSSSDAPAGRIWPDLWFQDGDVWMFGGHDDGSLGNTNEVWRYDLDGGGWALQHGGDEQTAGANGFCDFPADFVDPDLDAPERRNASVGVYTGDDVGFLVFGGKTDCGIINDAWSWSDGAWTERSTATAGEICLRAFAECSTMCF